MLLRPLWMAPPEGFRVDHMAHLSLEQVIDQRITAQGRVTFAEFMALALYWPGGGYYSSTSTAASARDYFTAPSAHPAFGALLALQLEEMWRLMGCPPSFILVEAGAGSGQLARDINAYASHLEASFAQALLYVTVDRSNIATPRAGSVPFQGVLSAGLPFRKVTGCILSNELLDAMPVHRVTLRDGRLREVYVTRRDGGLLEVEDELSTPRIEARLVEERVSLEEGQRAEVCLEMEPWQLIHPPLWSVALS